MQNMIQETVAKVGLHLYNFNVNLEQPETSCQIVQNCIIFISKYRSAFHLKSFLQRDILACYHSWKQFQALPVYKFEPDTKFDVNKAQEFAMAKLQIITDNFQKKYGKTPLFYLHEKESLLKSSQWEKEQFPTLLLSDEDMSHLTSLRLMTTVCKEFLDLVS